MPALTINLWFDTEAEEAAKLYTSLFPNSSIGSVSRYPNAGQEVTGKQAGEVMTVEFELDGQPFIGLNGGDAGFKPSESTSLVIYADTQEEIDHYWDGLTADGGEPGQCGWLKDKYGFSWQVTPRQLDRLLANENPETANRVMNTMLKMNKLVIADLEAAAQG